MTLNVNPDLALDSDNVTITTTVSGLKSLFPRYSIVHLMSRREVNKDLPGYALIREMGNLLYAKMDREQKEMLSYYISAMGPTVAPSSTEHTSFCSRVSF